MLPGARFSKVLETFRSREVIAKSGMNRASLHKKKFRRTHFSIFRYKWTKNVFTGQKSFRGFRETGPWSQLVGELSNENDPVLALRGKTYFFFVLQYDMVSSAQESDSSSIRTAQFSRLLNADWLSTSCLCGCTISLSRFISVTLYRLREIKEQQPRTIRGLKTGRRFSLLETQLVVNFQLYVFWVPPWVTDKAELWLEMGSGVGSLEQSWHTHKNVLAVRSNNSQCFLKTHSEVLIRSLIIFTCFTKFSKQHDDRRISCEPPNKAFDWNRKAL